MTRNELKKLMNGPIATVPTPFDDKYKLDLARMHDLTQWWVSQGLGTPESPIKVAAAGGEGPDLSDDEWPHLLRTAVNAAGPDKVIICGLKTKNTLHTIEDALKAQDLGAVGLQVDLPIFHHPNQDDYVRFFTDVSDAIDIGIIIYNTFWFGAESITAETMLRLKDAEHVVGLKWNTPSYRNKTNEPPYYDDMTQFSHIFNVIDNSSQPIRCHKNGGRGFISFLVAVHPSHDLGLWRLMEAGKYDEAQAGFDRVNQELLTFRQKVGKKSGGYRLIKGMMAAIGQPCGPMRPPTLSLDDAEMAELKEILRKLGWPVAA